jgi:hypothetical protein
MRYIGSCPLSTSTSPARRDYFARIKPNHILCAITGRGKTARVPMNV